MSLVLILSGRVVVQTIQNRPPDHDHPAFGVPGARQLAVKPFTTLPMGSSKRDAFFVVVRDATKPRMTPSDWQPTGTCR
jgi:hypothetical protein